MGNNVAMSIEHTVVFRIAHAQGSNEEAVFLAHARTELAGIPGVDEFTINRQVSPKSDLDLQFSMRFVDDDAYQAYNQHPIHVAFVEQRWTSEVVEFQEYDFVTL